MRTFDDQFITDTEVRDSTGKAWREWRGLLDAWVEREKRFASTTAYLVREHRLSHVWAQVVALYYVLDLWDAPAQAVP